MVTCCFYELLPIGLFHKRISFVFLFQFLFGHQKIGRFVSPLLSARPFPRARRSGTTSVAPLLLHVYRRILSPIIRWMVDIIILVLQIIYLLVADLPQT